MAASIPDVPTIVSTEPESFPWSVLTRRHPAIIDQVGDAHPYPPDTRHRLEELRDRITATVQPLPEGSPGKPRWDRWGAEFYGQRWLDIPFLWAESYFYHLLLDAVGYFGPGPWQGIDPFTRKQAELTDPALDTELSAGAEPDTHVPEQRTAALIHAALWGNRADLGFRLAGSPPTAHEAPGDILDDHTTEVADHLNRHIAGTIALIADNAGRELIPDLVLIDHLLRLHPALTVELHLKPQPYYVSDATTSDLLAALQRLAGILGQPRAVARRLATAMTGGRLRVRTHEFYCAPLSFHHLPTDLRADLALVDTVILKGDLNYRRLVGDRHWPATTSFTELTRYFPSRVIALRTLKSDVAVGLDAHVVASLERTEPGWRTSGSHGVVQLA
ncbi:damage-control phosphatase ARMT1 family protein [Nocardia paucivorans]|uniref:damage-control phosphatase ARMT1 family protein n=1 Tax=Nocardia paucivorans TaxID=114259 RepID=UPI000A30E249|nr:damage-control phosphatase ARMT1 family protein [Nocardia paucivorans]